MHELSTVYQRLMKELEKKTYPVPLQVHVFNVLSLLGLHGGTIQCSSEHVH